MKVIGVTGGVGMGKSACARLAATRGIAVVDTDDLARRIVEPGEPALAEIGAAFGPGMLDPAGHLRREELAQRVFADAASRRQLENILHPRIRRLWKAQAGIWASEGRDLAMVIIPLLFETQAETELDVTVCVACSAATQRARLLERGWSEQQIQRRLGAQLPIETKLARATFVIWTEGSLELHAAQLDRVLNTARSRSGAASIAL